MPNIAAFIMQFLSVSRRRERGHSDVPRYINVGYERWRSHRATCTSLAYDTLLWLTIFSIVREVYA
jgi:hypothetical protein